MSFVTLGPATLKDTICIGEDERTEDALPSFGRKSNFLLSPDTIPPAYFLMAFNKPWSYFTHLKSVPENHFSVAHTVLESI